MKRKNVVVLILNLNTASISLIQIKLLIAGTGKISRQEHSVHA